MTASQKPSEIWPQMDSTSGAVTRVSINNEQGQDGLSLLCIKGGQWREGEIMLRLPETTNTTSLLSTWNGVRTEKFRHNAYPGKQLIIISPEDSEYRELYTHLADDLHTQIHNVKSASKSVQIITDRLKLWGNFLKKTGGKLEDRKIRGLFAELKAIEEFIVPILGWQNALISWTGPSGAPQDITTPSLLLEIKATQMDEQLISISSIEQLDPPGNPEVRLLQAQIIEGSGENLSELIARLTRNAALDGAAGMLLARLGQYGFEQSLVAEEQGNPMLIKEWTLHQVNHPNFPAIRRHQIAEGVVQATYRIDLARSQAPIADLDSLIPLLSPDTP